MEKCHPDVMGILMSKAEIFDGKPGSCFLGDF